MSIDFTNIQNYYEPLVVHAVIEAQGKYPSLNPEHLPDVVCVALNRLLSRYIRHQVDLAFHMTDQEHQDNERLIRESIAYAFEFVQSRHAMRTRR